MIGSPQMDFLHKTCDWARSGFKGVEHQSLIIGMPTNTLIPEEDPYGPGGRLSHSSRWGHGLCPRAWFYEREWGWKGEALPILVFGHAVEECVCRVLRENPSLVAANAVSEVFDSPTRELGAYWRRRDRLNTIIDQRPEAAWNGPLLIPMGETYGDIESIMDWADARIAVHWPRAIASAHESWLADANRSGDWEEFMNARGHQGPQLAAAGIELHLEEVAKCLAAGGGAGLMDFRAGQRPDIPAPDGFPATHDQTHPCAKGEGDVSLLEAWELARPWFVDPEAGTFTQQAILPDGWFQGEYDLVYRWDGTSRIVDLKASDGRSEWAASYPVQMQTYAWLWWASHGKDEEVTGLETWYLGDGSRKVYPPPNTNEMQQFEDELHDFWEQHIATKGRRDIADYPPQPASVPSFAPGGGEQVGETDSSERCRQCYWAGECEGSGRKVDHDGATEFVDHDGSSHPLNNVSELVPRITVEGRIGTWKPNPWRFGGIAPALSLFTGGGSLWCSPYKGGPLAIADGISGGTSVRIEGGYLAPTRNGGVQLKLDEHTTINAIEKDEFEGHQSPTALHRANIRGRVMSLSGGEGETNWGKWKRWGAELATADGPIEISAMSENIPFAHDEVKRGDEVVVIAGYAAAFGDKKQLSFDAETVLRIL